MFGRRAEEGEMAAPVAHTPPQPRRGNVPAAESKIFTQGRTFAERKAQAEANRATLSQRRLVSLGQTEFPNRNRRTGQVEYLPAELFYDLDHPSKRYVRIDGDTVLHPLFDVNPKDPPPQRLPGRIRNRGLPSVLREPSQPEPPARPV